MAMSVPIIESHRFAIHMKLYECQICIQRPALNRQSKHAQLADHRISCYFQLELQKQNNYFFVIHSDIYLLRGLCLLTNIRF